METINQIKARVEIIHETSKESWLNLIAAQMGIRNAVLQYAENCRAVDALLSKYIV